MLCYSESNIKLYNDSWENSIDKLFDKEKIDLVLTSPPYNLGNNHHTRNVNTNAYYDDYPEEEYQEKQLFLLNKLYDMLSDTGSIIYNHKNRIKNGIQITPYEWILKSKFIVKQELVWVNGTPNFDKIRFYPATERLYWLSKTEKTQFYNVINNQDVFYWASEKQDKFHTRSFPLSMAIDIIKCFPQSNIIFDPYSGSGTTLLASKILNKRGYGIEISKKYCDIAISRLQKTGKMGRFL